MEMLVVREKIHTFALGKSYPKWESFAGKKMEKFSVLEKKSGRVDFESN